MKLRLGAKVWPIYGTDTIQLDATAEEWKLWMSSNTGGLLQGSVWNGRQRNVIVKFRLNKKKLIEWPVNPASKPTSLLGYYLYPLDDPLYKGFLVCSSSIEE